MEVLAKKPRGTKPKGRHPDKALSAAFCRKVAKAGQYCDGNGLYLHVDPTGARRWVQRLVIRGKSRKLGLGSYALVSWPKLASRLSSTASSRARAAIRWPRTAVPRVWPTFKEAAARVLQQKRAGWRSPKHAEDWPASLQLHAYPLIGEKLVSEITSADLLLVLGLSGTPSPKRRDECGNASVLS